MEQGVDRLAKSAVPAGVDPATAGPRAPEPFGPLRRSVSAVLLLAFAVVTARSPGGLPHPGLEWPLMAIDVALPLWWSRMREVPPTWSLVTFTVVMAALLGAQPRAGGLMVLSLVGTALGILRLPDGRALAFGGAVATLALFAAIRERLQLGSVQGLVDMVVAYSVGFGALISSRQRTRHHWETERLLADLAEEHRRLGAAHARLAEHARSVAELAASEERGRIAREIHDVLAHALTAIIVQAEAASVRLRTDPPAASEQIQSLAALARGALQEARLSVAAIRANPGAAGMDVLRRLCADAERWSGMRCAFTVRGAQQPLPAPVAHAAYRILQEALTNAHRHGRAAEVEVSLAFGPGALTLTVDNDLPQPEGMAQSAAEGAGEPEAGPEIGPVATAPFDAPAQEGSAPAVERVGALPGSGLRGMRERAEGLGGHLRAGRAPGGGFRVAAVLPLPAVPASEASA